MCRQLMIRLVFPSLLRVTEVKTDEPKALVSVDSMVNWSNHAAENKTGEVEKVYGMMAGLHADNGGAGISNAADEFAMMGISPKTQRPMQIVIQASRPRQDFPPAYNIQTLPSRSASVPAGSRNSSASVTADGTDPAAKNRPAVNSAGRPKPTERVGQPAGWSKRPAPVSAGGPGDPSTDNDIGIVDSGCSRSMTGNKEKLDDFVQVKGGIVKFGGGDGRISGKGTIKTSKLDFENVYYVEELQHFNLFSVSQICDKKNKVLFNNTDCLVLSEEFQIPDESQRWY
ncbi:hypothetical protein Tco_0373715 [Tanacetum coccineum]